jgi:hypothetical protein
MENSEKYSGEELCRPEIAESTWRTLREVIGEIQEIINSTHWVETRLAKLKAIGFKIEHCWVKNGSIATIWYMKRKKVFRIQVTDSEIQGNYNKAFCVIILEIEVDLRNFDISTIRNKKK